MAEELDDQGNPIINDEWGEPDYKALWEQAEAKADKYKGMFKWEKAKQQAQPTVNVDEIVSKATEKVNSELNAINFYSNNKEAMESREDIEALVAKGIERDKAYKYVIAEKNPELLLDEAKRNQLSWGNSLNGVPEYTNGQKNLMAMSDEEISKLSDEEFDKLAPKIDGHKKFYAE